MRHVWDTRRPAPPPGYELARCMRCGLAIVSKHNGQRVFVIPYSTEELVEAPPCRSRR